MSVDYTDLDKACPKDTYPPPNIDWLINNTTGYELFSFLDAYSGYNQIQIYPLDQDKTTFMTEGENYCYKVMPFGIKMQGPPINDSWIRSLKTSSTTSLWST